VTGDAGRTVAFVDLIGYTSLTDTHGDAVAVQVVDQLLAATKAAVAGRGRIVKTLGDGVLLDFTRPDDAVAAAAAINESLHSLDGMPELSGGIATGPVIDRDGDIFGATVNLAARLADLAPPGELRVTDPAARASSAAGWTVEPVGPTTIRGMHDPVSVHRVLLCPPQECVTDPVCGMRITTRPDTPSATVGDGTVWFCTVTCADRFNADAGRYLVEARSHG
jgi:adenylate cyclase